MPFDLQVAKKIENTLKTESSSPIMEEKTIPSSNFVKPIINIYLCHGRRERQSACSWLREGPEISAAKRLPIALIIIFYLRISRIHINQINLFVVKMSSLFFYYCFCFPE